mgnify:CR=1 FL=1
MDPIQHGEVEEVLGNVKDGPTLTIRFRGERTTSLTDTALFEVFQTNPGIYLVIITVDEFRSLHGPCIAQDLVEWFPALAPLRERLV